MPRASGIKQLIAPSGGLVTEQSKLTPTEGTTIDELNFSFNDDGSVRRRRNGLNIEDGSNFFTLSDTVNTTNATSYVLWESVAGEGGTNFHVFQIGATLYFIKDASGNLQDQVQAFTFDLDTAVAPTFTTVETEPVSMVGGNGSLFVAGKMINPFYIEYDSTGPSLSATYVGIGVRDLTGVDDGLEVDKRQLLTLSELHEYNLKNQGWWQQRRIVAAGAFVDPIAKFFTTNSLYPSNSDISYLGMVDDGSGNLIYDADYILELSLGNTPAAKGHFIVDPFIINYDGYRTGTDTGGGGYGGSVGSSSTSYSPTTYTFPSWWDDSLIDFGQFP